MAWCVLDCYTGRYGCGVRPGAHLVVTVLWPLLVAALMLLELVQALNAVLLELPIHLLRLVSFDGISPLQVRACVRYSFVCSVLRVWVCVQLRG